MSTRTAIIHPAKKNIPESINKRLSTISSTKAAFDEASPTYQEALKQSGYDYKVTYSPPPSENSSKTNKRRKRHITWYNPPYSTNVKNNIGKQFLTLIDKCFPPNHPLHKILNRNTVKISYSCMPNTKQIISAHNKSVLNKQETNEQKLCNCRRGNPCPLDRKCLTPNIIYQATVQRDDNNHEETYIGLTENSFKTRYNNHTSSFRNESKRTSTTLSQYIWDLKDNNISYSLKWRIISKCSSYSPSSKKCNLCIKEKYFIICKPELGTLNNRNELASECKHRKKHLLCNSG